MTDNMDKMIGGFDRVPIKKPLIDVGDGFDEPEIQALVQRITVPRIGVEHLELKLTLEPSTDFISLPSYQHVGGAPLQGEVPGQRTTIRYPKEGELFVETQDGTKILLGPAAILYRKLQENGKNPRLDSTNGKTTLSADYSKESTK